MSGKLSRNRGRQFEQAVARYMGAHRNHFEAEDIEHSVLSIECKHRQRHSRMLVKWFAQCEAAAQDKKVPKVPVLVLHEERQEYGNSYAVMRLKDLRDLVGD